MDRPAWLLERRAAVEASYDSEAPTYDENPYAVETQRRFVERLVATCPPDGVVLDAPCGTGQYFALVAAAGRRVVGIDQSAGMLAQAQARGIAVALHQVGLQELVFEEEFDAAMTVDAMENVFPEDWPAVLANLRRAVRQGGHLYLTVEEVPETDLEEAFADLRARALAPLRTLPVATARRLEETLRAWLLHQGRRDEVAAALFVHPQTVRYRMSQLRELFPDLASPHRVLELTLAVGLRVS